MVHDSWFSLLWGSFLLTLRPVKINSLFLILRARSFSSDYGKNKGKKQRFIFHFLITIIVKFCFFLLVLSSRARVQFGKILD